jgi:hypothetical protein
MGMKELTELNESSFQSEFSESGKALLERGTFTGAAVNLNPQ